MKIPNSAKERAFCEYYAETEEGTQSAIKAGYSVKTAGQQAYNLRQVDYIQAYIQYLISEKEAKKRKDEERLREKANISKEQILERLKVIGFSQLSDFVDYEEPTTEEVDNPDYDPDKEDSVFNNPKQHIHKGGLRIKSFKDVDPEKLPALLEFAEVDTMAGKNRKVKLHNPLAALSQICDLLGYKAAEKKEIVVHDSALDKTNFSIKTRAPEIE